MPDVLPIKPKEGHVMTDFKTLMLNNKPWEETKQEVTPGGDEGPSEPEGPPSDWAYFQYDLAPEDQAYRGEFLSKFDLIRKRKIAFAKPAVLIFNPAACKKGDVIPLIQERLYDRQIAFELLTCENPLDTFNFAKDLDTEKYSVVVAIGDDATFHEVVNGMLAREDKAKLPVAIIPTTTESDLCLSLGISSMDHALDFLVKGEATPMDTTRVLLDHDREDTLPEGAERLNFCRHMLSNSCMSMPAKIQGSTNSLNFVCGGAASSLATMWNGGLMGYTLDGFEVEIDGAVVDQEANVKTCMLAVNNGRYSNGGYAINPFACINDGLLDISWIRDEAWTGMLGVNRVYKDAKKGGIQAYAGHTSYMRGKKVKVTFQEKVGVEPPQAKPTDGEEGEERKGDETPQKPDFGEQAIGVDGQDFTYKNTVTWECIP